MRGLDKIRNLLFWLIDFLKGGAVLRHNVDITQIMTSTVPWVKQCKIQERLMHILTHAAQSTEFYRTYDPDRGIEAFPVINKTIIRENETKLLSNRFDESARIPVVTSGSTGTPFRTFQDVGKKRRNTADTIYFARLAGYNLGNRLYYFKIWSDYNKKSFVLQKLQNIVPIDVLNLKARVSEVMETLNSNSSPVSFLGYVSAFETICKELDKGSVPAPKVAVNSIVTMSESLNEYTRRAAEAHFSCPVLSRYSNIENGIIAQQTLANRRDFTINQASYYVEVMDMYSDTLVPNGTLGRIVVTDYFNRVMPLIRYDTGDLGVMRKQIIDGVEQLVFARIEGRRLDQIYNTRGELISSYIVYKNMWKYTEIEQYQFVQKGAKDYAFKICTPGPFHREAELTGEFKEYLGKDADFKIEYVSDIPLLNSGKRKKVVNEMNRL